MSQPSGPKGAPTTPLAAEPDVRLVGTGLDALKNAGWQVIPGAELARFGWADVPTVPLKLRADLDPVRQTQQVVADIEEIRRLALG